MSRVLLATLGSLGDLHPYIAVGRALLARGLEFAPLIAESRGFPWLSSVLAPYSLFSTTDPSIIPNFEWLQRLPRFGSWPHGMLLNLVRASVRRWERPLHTLRAELGLPPVKGALLIDGQFSHRGTLALFDRSLATPQPDWPADH